MKSGVSHESVAFGAVRSWRRLKLLKKKAGKREKWLKKGGVSAKKMVSISRQSSAALASAGENAEKAVGISLPEENYRPARQSEIAAWLACGGMANITRLITVQAQAQRDQNISEMWRREHRNE
jgi:hypothetical protein